VEFDAFPTSRLEAGGKSTRKDRRLDQAIE